MKIKIRALLIMLSSASICAIGQQSSGIYDSIKHDTTYISYESAQPLLIPKNKQYHQTLTMKLFLSQALFDGKYKRRDNGNSTVALTFNEALDIIRRIDNLTIGIPKIIYLVGWQYNGHDSKYPAWFEGNERLKRPQDENAMESIKWLMKEAKQFNTTVSLHINMFDAYEDSPLWNEYLDHHIIAKNKDGSPRQAEWGYPISYAQEWATGYVQKRIDSLCSLLPLQEAGTIHIDAFHSWPPLPSKDQSGKEYVELQKDVISPYLNFTVENETEAQRNIFKYWAKKGIDVTSEGVDFLRISSFEGYQPMGWWFGGLHNYLKWPASYYCGGRDNSEWGKLFGTSMHAEDIVKKDPTYLSGFKEQFCMNTVIWYFLNRLDRKYLITSEHYKEVHYSKDVSVSLTQQRYSIKQGNVILVENNDMLMPAQWISETAMVAYSKEGYQRKKWTLPKEYKNIKKINVYRITQEGKTFIKKQSVRSGCLRLTLNKNEILYLERID